MVYCTASPESRSAACCHSSVGVEVVRDSESIGRSSENASGVHGIFTGHGTVPGVSSPITPNPNAGSARTGKLSSKKAPSREGSGCGRRANSFGAPGRST